MRNLDTRMRSADPISPEGHRYTIKIAHHAGERLLDGHRRRLAAKSLHHHVCAELDDPKLHGPDSKKLEQLPVQTVLGLLKVDIEYTECQDQSFIQLYTPVACVALALPSKSFVPCVNES